jgi:hypothetical protein
MPGPVTEARILRAALTLRNARAIARACRAEGLAFFHACALVEKESGGKNIYGHDKGGVNTVSGSMGVTDKNFLLFLVKVMNGATSNGVGPLQITYAGARVGGHRDGGYFRQMAEAGLRPWVPEENMRFGFRIFVGLLKKHNGDVAKAGAEYNGGPNPNEQARQYGRTLRDMSLTWKKRFRIR